MFEPLEIPDPFHPAVAHFPIVLTLLGTLLAFGALLTRRMALPFWTFLVLFLATVGAQYAVVTGAQESTGDLPQAVRAVMQQHIAWSERTRTFDLIATLVALLTLMVTRWPRVRRYFAFGTLLLGAFTSYSALRAAEQGRALVYDYGVGVSAPAAGARNSPGPSVTPSPAPAASPETAPH